MSLFHQLRRRRAKVLFVCQSDSDLNKIEEALSKVHVRDVMDPCISMAEWVPNLPAFDVIVNLSRHLVQPGVYVLSANIDRIEQIVEFLASHFRWARDWQINEEDAIQTTPAPTPIVCPPPVVARLSF